MFIEKDNSLSVLFLLPSQPVDADQSIHLPEFGVPSDHGGFLLDGGGNGKAVGIGKDDILTIIDTYRNGLDLQAQAILRVRRPDLMQIKSFSA